MRERFEPTQLAQDTGATAAWFGAILEGRGLTLSSRNVGHARSENYCKNQRSAWVPTGYSDGYPR